MECIGVKAINLQACVCVRLVDRDMTIPCSLDWVGLLSSPPLALPLTKMDDWLGGANHALRWPGHMHLRPVDACNR